MSIVKNKLIHLAKNLIPPFFYNLIKNVIIGKKVYKPIWNILSYHPMNSVKMFFDPTGSWQRKMMVGTYDAFLFDTLKTMKPEGKIIFDIGAHIGFHSLYFAKLVGNNGKVYSFEPNPVNFERFNLILSENKDLNERVKVFNVAVSNKSEVVEFNVNNDIESGRSSGNFIESADPFWHKDVYTEKGFSKSKTQTIRMDYFREELGITDLPDIIKIDVEGAEYLVLLGAKNTLLKKKPILFIEIHSITNMFNVVYLLSSLGYDLKILRKEPNNFCYIEAKTRRYHH